jgi:hypothetical protein
LKTTFHPLAKSYPFLNGESLMIVRRNTQQYFVMEKVNFIGPNISLSTLFLKHAGELHIITLRRKKGTRTPRQYKETHNTHTNTPHTTLATNRAEHTRQQKKSTHTQPEYNPHCGEPKA